MEQTLYKHSIQNFTTKNSVRYKTSDITYQVFGKQLDEAPVVLVNHALTGNSDLAGEERGWWKTIIGKEKLIDTDKYSVIGINIPGNGYDGNLVENEKDFTASDIAELFIQTLTAIGVNKLYAAIGGSLGGSIAWEMAVLKPGFIEHLIPIASGWQASDWIIGQNYVQESILNNSKQPLHDARMMAMLFYRTSESFSQKFNRTINEHKNCYNVESWLDHHGTKLAGRFDLSAYKLMNHLLTTVNIVNGKGSFEETVKPIQSNIIQIGIDTDLLFVPEEMLKTKAVLDKLGKANAYYEIKSVHGHDAFLIEFEQLTQFLNPYFR